MNTEQFFKMVDLGKQMKKDIMRINANVIMGTDSTFNSLSVICTDMAFCDYSESFIYGKNELTAFLKKSNNPEFKYNVLENENEEIFPLYNTFIDSEIRSMYKNCLEVEKNAILYQDLDIRNDIEFEKCIQLKSADGIKMYKIQNTFGLKFIISIFNGMLPVNKGDKVSLNIYDMGAYFYLCKFTVYKKKNVVIDCYYQCRYLCN